MSNLPRIKDAVVDRRTLDILEMVEKEISTFRGIRHLWAEAVAIGHASNDDLMAEQERVLWSAIGQAMVLCAHAFPGKSPHRSFAALVTMPASEPPSDSRHVLAATWRQYDDGGEIGWVWGSAYYDQAGWWSVSGGRIYPAFWCEIAKPILSSE